MRSKCSTKLPTKKTQKTILCPYIQPSPVLLSISCPSPVKRGDDPAMERGQVAGTGPEGAGEMASLTGPTSEQLYPGLHCFCRLRGLDVSEGLIQQDITSWRV